MNDSSSLAKHFRASLISKTLWAYIAISGVFCFSFECIAIKDLISNIVVAIGVLLGAAVTGLTIIGGILCQRDFASIAQPKSEALYNTFLEAMRREYQFIVYSFTVSMTTFALLQTHATYATNPFPHVNGAKILLFIALIALRYALTAIRDIVFSFLKLPEFVLRGIKHEVKIQPAATKHHIRRIPTLAKTRKHAYR